MALQTSLYIVSSLVIIYWTEACDVGWFGHNCQYKCRCSDNSCSKNGSCINGTNCLGGWFGPGCQFADIAYLRGLESGITDNNDSTCGPTIGVNTVNVVFEKPHPLTWLRIRVRSSAASILQDAILLVRVWKSRSDYIPYQRQVRVDETTLDIHINRSWHVIVNENYNQVIVLDIPSRDVCSLYISGGRNVALKQPTSQSSTYSEGSIAYSSDKAVDGNTHSIFHEQHTCTHTAVFQSFATWSVAFTHPVTVNRYLLYNRDAHPERLSGFALHGYQTNGTKVVDYRNNPATIESVYSVLLPGLGSEVSRVDIQTNHSQHILTLCEVEIYGDSLCEPGRYGRDCEHRCNCVGDEPCSVSTGGCPSGCADGYRGEACDQPCQQGFYGESCNSTCSELCLIRSSNESSCDHVDGRCLHGCVSGYKGLSCSTPCPSGEYGENCNSSCSEFCWRPSSNERLCDHVDGRCLNGCVSGYQGLHCSTPCSPGEYGDGCGSKCSEFCSTRSSNESSCDNLDGRCLHGCQEGYQGLLCISPCWPGKFGKNCKYKCSKFCLRPSFYERPCHHVDGRCLLGCVTGYKGPRCCIHA